MPGAAHRQTDGSLGRLLDRSERVRSVFFPTALCRGEQGWVRGGPSFLSQTEASKPRGSQAAAPGHVRAFLTTGPQGRGKPCSAAELQTSVRLPDGTREPLGLQRARCGQRPLRTWPSAARDQRCSCVGARGRASHSPAPSSAPRTGNGPRPTRLNAGNVWNGMLLRCPMTV